MRYLIVLEPTKAGFSVQVPDLAIITFGKTIPQAKQAAIEAIKINLETYREVGQKVPKRRPISTHWKNPDFTGLLFTHVDVDVHQHQEIVLA